MKDGALERAEYDCRLRAAMLLLEPDLPDVLAQLMPNFVLDQARSWRDRVDPETELPEAFFAAFRALERAVRNRTIARAIAQREQRP